MFISFGIGFLPQVSDWISKRLTRDARFFHRMWSFRLGLFWAAVSGFYAALPAFQDWFSPIHFAMLSVAFSLSICIATITKQKISDE